MDKEHHCSRNLWSLYFCLSEIIVSWWGWGPNFISTVTYYWAFIKNYFSEHSLQWLLKWKDGGGDDDSDDVKTCHKLAKSGLQIMLLLSSGFLVKFFLWIAKSSFIWWWSSFWSRLMCSPAVHAVHEVHSRYQTLAGIGLPSSHSHSSLDKISQRTNADKLQSAEYIFTCTSYSKINLKNNLYVSFYTFHFVIQLNWREKLFQQ